MSRARRILSAAFLLLVIGLLLWLATRIDWREVGRTLAATPPSTLVGAAAVALIGHGVYTTFDVLGKVYTGHRLPVRQIVPVTFVCYAFNLNLGAWLGSVALRYRLYARLGLDAAVITRILSFSLATNWLAFLALGGTMFALGLVPLPPDWSVSAGGLRVVGLLLLALALGYLALCTFARRRVWHVRGHELRLPTARLACAQILLGACNWALMALVIYVLLGGRAPYPSVLAVLLLSAIAGVVSHVPAGLGVIEAVFTAILGATVGRSTVLAALIGYRAVYFLLPLALAAVIYLALESAVRRRGHILRS